MGGTRAIIRVLLQTLLKESSSNAVLQSLLLETLRGRYRAVASIAGHEFWFEIREEVVDDLLEAGKADALDGIRRIASVAVLPYTPELKVS